jgi:hypothetical protein
MMDLGYCKKDKERMAKRITDWRPNYGKKDWQTEVQTGG